MFGKIIKISLQLILAGAIGAGVAGGAYYVREAFRANGGFSQDRPSPAPQTSPSIYVEPIPSPTPEITPIPTPAPSPTAPSSQTIDDREFSCTMLGEYKYGMTLDDFSALHYKNYSAAPACQTENGAAKCKGHIAIGSIHGIAEFLFDDNKLFSISGSFDPREFLTVKNVFIAKFGEPSGIGVCRDPALNVSSSCEDLAWSKYGSLIMLHENYGSNGEQFVIFPPINQKHDDSSCPVAFITRNK